MTKKKGTLQLTAKEISAAKHLAALGRSTRSIARELGRSPHTIARLLEKPTVAAEVSTKKIELSDLYELRARQTLEGVSEEDIKKASLQQKAISSGVFLDKARLIRGESTSNLDLRVLADVLVLIREKRDSDGDDVQRDPEQAPRILTAAPEPVTPVSVPNNARLVHAASPPTPDPAPTVAPRVRYTSVRADKHPDHERESVLLHGLRGE